MTTKRLHWVLRGLCLTAVLLAPVWAAAQTSFTSMVIFGDSLSDPGNLFALEKQNNKPPYADLGELLIPEFPYARGGNHFSNGATWAEQLGRRYGRGGDVRPAFRGNGKAAHNFAVGGARAHDDGINVNFEQQVQAFLQKQRSVDGEALYVIEFGSNDIRDALEAYAAGADGSAVLGEALTAYGANLEALYAAGARKFLLCNAPDFSLTPAIGMLETVAPGTADLARLLSTTYNEQLALLLDSYAGLPDIELVRFDFFALLNDMVATPAQFGLKVVDTPCVTPNQPPFACKKANQYLFWDGAHPTKTVHDAVATAAAATLDR